MGSLYVLLQYISNICIKRIISGYTRHCTVVRLDYMLRSAAFRSAGDHVSALEFLLAFLIFCVTSWED